MRFRTAGIQAVSELFVLIVGRRTSGNAPVLQGQDVLLFRLPIFFVPSLYSSGNANTGTKGQSSNGLDRLLVSLPCLRSWKKGLGMARNKYGGPCYRCEKWVEPGKGHFERYAGDWRVQHAEMRDKGKGT